MAGGGQVAWAPPHHSAPSPLCVCVCVFQLHWECGEPVIVFSRDMAMVEGGLCGDLWSSLPPLWVGVYLGGR